MSEIAEHVSPSGAPARACAKYPACGVYATATSRENYVGVIPLKPRRADLFSKLFQTATEPAG